MPHFVYPEALAIGVKADHQPTDRESRFIRYGGGGRWFERVADDPATDRDDYCHDELIVRYSPAE